MAAAADPVPAILTADGKNILEPDTKKSGFVDTEKLSSDSLPLSEAELKANPFLDPNVAQTYRLIYEKAEYECREAFEPDLQWTAAEEKKVKHKLDLHVTVWSCIMFLALNIDRCVTLFRTKTTTCLQYHDRGNLKQAVADNLLDDLGLTTNDYNTGETSAIFALSVRLHGQALTNSRQHNLLPLLLGRRIAVAIDLEEARTGQVDSDADHPMVHRCCVPGCDERKD